MGLDITGFGAAFDFARTVIDKIFPDKTEAEKLKAQLATLDLTQEFQTMMGQIQTNLEEAKSQSWWVAGWRPYVGWVCGTGFAWQYVIGPFFVWFSTLFGHPTPMVMLESGELMTLLIGMLGLGGLRSYDKFKKNGKTG